MQLTDEMLVQRCLNGDKEAFGFLVDRYKESVFGLAYSKIGNVHDAQDIAQEAFLSAYKNLRQFRHPMNNVVKRWIIKSCQRISTIIC